MLVKVQPAWGKGVGGVDRGGGCVMFGSSWLFYVGASMCCVEAPVECRECIFIVFCLVACISIVVSVSVERAATFVGVDVSTGEATSGTETVVSSMVVWAVESAMGAAAVEAWAVENISVVFSGVLTMAVAFTESVDFSAASAWIIGSSWAAGVLC